MTYASKTTFCLNNLNILRPRVKKKSYEFALEIFVNSHSAHQLYLGYGFDDAKPSRLPWIVKCGNSHVIYIDRSFRYTL